jgi:MFS family permease
MDEAMSQKPGAQKAPVTAIHASSWWMLAVLFTLYVFSWVDRLILSMLVGPIKADLQLSDFQMSLLLGPAFAVCYAIFGIPLGWAVDRYSRRLLIFLGVTMWAAATTASGLATSFEMLFFARVLVGTGEAVLLPAAYSMIADEFPRERMNFATSIFQMAGKTGSAVAFGMGGVAIAYAESLKGVAWPILGDAEAWHRVMVMVGLPGFILGLLVFSFAEPVRKNLGSDLQARAEQSDLSRLKIFLRGHWQIVTLMMIGFSAMSICGFTLTSWVPTYLGRVFHWQPIQYGSAIGAMNLIAAVSLVINGRIVDHLFSRGMKDAPLRFYTWIIFGILPAAILMFLTDEPYIFLACYALVQFTTVPFVIYVSSVVALLTPNSLRGTLIAIFLFVFTILGMGAGPALVGVLNTFVFHDDNMIGTSLMIIVVSCFVVGFTAIRRALKYLAPAVIRAEAAAELKMAQAV